VSLKSVLTRVWIILLDGKDVRRVSLIISTGKGGGSPEYIAELVLIAPYPYIRSNTYDKAPEVHGLRRGGV
jgi:hypothetical protein